jgi:anti-sigma factor RsiW
MEGEDRQMICSRELIEGYLDGELDSFRRTEVEEHLATCPRCGEEYAQLREQQANIRSQAPYYPAPPQLQQSLRAALREEAAAGSGRDRRDSPWRLLAIAASVLLAVSLIFNLRQLPNRTPENETVAQALISDHVRSLIGTHLLDVVSSDQHTVKPWFNGKLDYAPVVKDCAAQGFPLIGARIEYVSNRAVAALVYKRREHVINLFTWPAASSDVKASSFARNGFHVVQWSDPSMTYWAISDLNPAELQQFTSVCVKE